MSGELTKARQMLSQIKSGLKQDKYISAVQSLHDALVIVMSNPLMRAEKEEFARLLSDNLHALDSNPGFRKLIPLKLDYSPGGEKQLLGGLRDCLSELQNSALSEAKLQLEEIERRKAEGLRIGQELIDLGEFEKAKAHFDVFLNEHAWEAELTGDVGERFLKAGRYEEAYDYLAKALEISPESIHLYNRIGIALRKLGRFDTAEKYYMKALESIKDEPNLYFNMGRLYIDWGKWDKVVHMAEKALKHNPGFSEAAKMLAFARKKMDG